MELLWTNEVKAPNFPKLSGDGKTDVLIIGGGMAGILCAKQLHDAGIEYILVEAKKVGLGITKGTTAVLSAQHDTLYSDIMKKFGNKKAKQYLNANIAAVNRFRKLSEQIDCDFETKPSVMYSLTDRLKMEDEARTVKLLGYPVEFTTDLSLPLTVAGAVKFPDMAQFHPLKFLYAIASKLNIYENTFIKKLSGTTAYTEHGVIHAKKVIIATHFPFLRFRGKYFMKMYQRRSYVIAYENTPDLDATFEDASENGFYLRRYKDMLLIGGADHRTGKQSKSTGSQPSGYEAVREFAGKYFPEAIEKYYWSNQDCVTLDGIPYIGEYSSLPGVYVATGFNHWGMTSSMVASEILCDMVMGKSNPNAPVFAPDRSILRGQLFANLGNYLLDIITPTAKRCPHMGCALKWNPLEQSWDCPCHGSRFDKDGKLIDNPAKKDIN
jgi:glycine/D-amino acid oxidase-like deaminating enzyme